MYVASFRVRFLVPFSEKTMTRTDVPNCLESQMEHTNFNVYNNHSGRSQPEMSCCRSPDTKNPAKSCGCSLIASKSPRVDKPSTSSSSSVLTKRRQWCRQRVLTNCSRVMKSTQRLSRCPLRCLWLLLMQIVQLWLP